MPDVNQEHEKCSTCGGEKDAEGWCAIYCTEDIYDVSMTHTEVVAACKEWLLKNNGLIARNPVLVVDQEKPDRTSFNLLFVGIKPKDVPKETGA
jgi:hypothetical protein